MSEDQIYREVLLERFSNPINQGVINTPDWQARVVNNLCGDEILLQIKTAGETIEQARYSGNGCAISQVSASFLAEYLEGKEISQVSNIKESDILEMLGVNVGPARLKCALLSFEVLKKALSIKNDKL